MVIRVVLISFISVIFCFQISFSETVKLATGEWLPYLSEDLKHGGVIAHIVERAFELEGMTVEYEFLPWKRGLVMVENGQIDGAAVWGYNKDRTEWGFYSEPVLTGKLVFFHLKSTDFEWNSVDDLTSLKIGGTFGDKYGKEITTAEDSGKIRLYRASSPILGFKKLLAGRIDIYPMDRDAGYALLQEELSTSDFNKITHNPNAIRTSVYHVLLSKKSAKIRPWLKNLIEVKKLKDSGEYDEMMRDSQTGKYKK